MKKLGGLYPGGTKLEIQRETLVTIASGNLILEEGLPLSRLPDLLGAQSSFGSAVGSPVLFYLSAFIYTILGLRNNPSSHDAANSLGFGIEWMIIVHVAFVSGCPLASNNPGTSSGIFGSENEALKSRLESNLQQASSRQSISKGEDSEEDPQQQPIR